MPDHDHTSCHIPYVACRGPHPSWLWPAWHMFNMHHRNTRHTAATYLIECVSNVSTFTTKQVALPTMVMQQKVKYCRLSATSMHP